MKYVTGYYQDHENTLSDITEFIKLPTCNLKLHMAEGFHINNKKKRLEIRVIPIIKKKKQLRFEEYFGMPEVVFIQLN